MNGFVRDVANKLNERAETLCRKYLSNGTKVGSYWMVGSIDNEKGDSFVVHITGAKQGKWFENATGQSGDMFDLVKHIENIPNSLGAAKFSAHSLLQLPSDCKPAEKKQPKKKIGNLTVDAKREQTSAKEIAALSRSFSDRIRFFLPIFFASLAMSEIRRSRTSIASSRAIIS